MRLNVHEYAFVFTVYVNTAVVINETSWNHQFLTNYEQRQTNSLSSEGILIQVKPSLAMVLNLKPVSDLSNWIHNTGYTWNQLWLALCANQMCPPLNLNENPCQLSDISYYVYVFSYIRTKHPNLMPLTTLFQGSDVPSNVPGQTFTGAWQQYSQTPFLQPPMAHITHTLFSTLAEFVCLFAWGLIALSAQIGYIAP